MKPIKIKVNKSLTMNHETKEIQFSRFEYMIEVEPGESSLKETWEFSENEINERIKQQYNKIKGK